MGLPGCVFPGCVLSGLNLFRVMSLPGCGSSGLWVFRVVGFRVVGIPGCGFPGCVLAPLLLLQGGCHWNYHISYGELCLEIDLSLRQSLIANSKKGFIFTEAPVSRRSLCFCWTEVGLDSVYWTEDLIG